MTLASPAAVVWVYTLGSVVAVSAMSLIGAVLLGIGRRRLHRITNYLVSLAVGGLLGGALLHLIPQSLEVYEESEVVWLLVITGFFASFMIEKFIGGHSHGHDGHQHTHVHLPERRATPRPNRPLPMVGVVLVGDAVHNFLDGILIAGAYLLDPSVGLITTFIVLLHELPQEFGDFGVLVSGGLSIRRALMWNLITAIAAVIGAVLALAVGWRISGFANVVVPLAAGNFLYIAGADLVPHLHEDETPGAAAGQLAMAILGVALMIGVHELHHLFLE